MAAYTGLEQLEEADWTEEDGNAPAVQVSADNDDYPWEHDTAEEIADAYNLLERIKTLDPSVMLDLRENLDIGYEADRESCSVIRSDLRDQYEASTIRELYENEFEDLVDADGEPLYPTISEFRQHMRELSPEQTEPQTEELLQ